MRKLVLMILVVAFSQNLTGQVTFIKSIDLTSLTAFQNLGNLKKTLEGGYILSCIAEINSVMGVALIKTDSTGEIQFAKFYSDSSNIYRTWVDQSSDSGFVVSLSIYYPTFNDMNMGAMKTDKNGNVSWIKSFGNNDSYQEGTSVIAIEDGYIFFGTGYTQSSIYKDILVIKTDLDGNTIWSKDYEGGGNEYQTFACKTTDNNFILTSPSSSTSVQTLTFLMKIDSNGSVIWSEKIYDTNVLIDPQAVAVNNNGDIIITGRTDVVGPPQWDILFLKLSSTGIFKWCKSLGGADINTNDEGYGVFQTSDQGYMIAAEPESFENKSQISLIKTDSSGNSQWMKTYPDTSASFPFGALQNADNGFTIFGNQGNYGQQAALTLIRTDSLGITSCYKEVVPTINSYTMTIETVGSVSNFIGSDNGSLTNEDLNIEVQELSCEKESVVEPDPQSIVSVYFSSGSELIIDFNSLNHPVASLKIFDELGQIVFQENQIRSQKISIETSQFVKGIYFYNLSSGSTILKSGELVFQ